jgi:rhomboid protease GluP
MNFTIHPKHIEVEPTNDLTTDDALVFSLLAAAELGWRLSNIGDLGFYAYPDYQSPDRPVSEELTVQIEDDKIIVTSISKSAWDFVSSNNRRRVRDFIRTFRGIIATTTHEQGNEKLKELSGKRQIVSVQVDPLHSTTPFNPLLFFVPKEGYFITPILVILNLLMFIVLTAVGVNILEPEPLDLMAWGGNFRAARIEGEWWRLITGSFLHNGFIQFALNMYALIAIGWMIEPQIGKANFLGAYLSAAVVSGMTNLLWLDDATVSTGAAGAIFGVYGVFIALLSTNVIERANRPIVIVNTLIFMAYTLLTGLKPGMSNSANVAGMVTGMLIGYCLYPVLLQPEGLVRKYITLGVIILVLGGSTALAYRSLPGGDMAEYQERIRGYR